MFRYHAKIAIPKQLIGMDLSRAEAAVAQEMVDIMTPYVPAKTGALSRSATVSGNRITYHGEAVNLLYMGKRKGQKLEMSKEVHGRAQSHWFYGAKKDNMHLIQRHAVREIKKELKIK